MTAEPNLMDVFSKVIGHLALYARDLGADVYRALDVIPLQFNDDVDTTVPHPFICQRNTVQMVKPMIDVSGMVREASTCMLHSYSGVAGCSLHPVTHDALLAAYALGGLDAVLGKQPVGYSKGVQRLWVSMLQHFHTAIMKHDEALQHDDHYIQRSAVGSVPLPAEIQPNMAIQVKIRPGDPLYRRRKKRR